MSKYSIACEGNLTWANSQTTQLFSKDFFPSNSNIKGQVILRCEF